MQLVDNAGAILTKAWSMKFWAISSLLMLLELMVPLLEPQVPHNAFLVLSFLAGIAGMAARLIAQLGLKDEPVPVAKEDAGA